MGNKCFYTLTFTYTFEYDNDSVFFSYCYPYSYTDLNNDIAAIEQDLGRRKFIQRGILCKTLAGVDCQLLTITSPIKKIDSKPKKGVLISARVHPGETVGSWMMRGVINFLTDPEDREAAILRDNFVFKIIPMLNPDGVINGNYRCSLAGCDLNRRWKFPSKTLHPTVYATKKLVK
jgi:cytosolic carboxypeptidase protein 2/3